MNTRQAKARRRRERQRENRKLGKQEKDKSVKITTRRINRPSDEKSAGEANGLQAKVCKNEVELDYLPCTDWSLLTVGTTVRFKQIEMCPLGNGVQLREYSGRIVRICENGEVIRLDSVDRELSLPDMMDLEFARVE